MELVAVCDLDEEAAMSMAREFGTRAETDFSSLLDGSVDCIHLCTPVQTHFDLARQAIEAGVAIVIEKPATVTAEEIAEIDELATEHDVPATVIHNHLFDPAVRKARRMIDRGEIGQLIGVDVIYAGLTPPDMENRGSWVFDLPGGEFEEGLPHPIYSVLGVGGFPEDIEAVSAHTSLSRTYDGGFSYDQAQIQYVAENGALCTVKMLSGTKPQRLHVINGTERSIVVDEINQSVSVTDEDYTASTLARSKKALDVSLDQFTSSLENAKLVAATQFDDSWENEVALNSHYVIFDRFAKAIEYGTEIPVPLEQSTWTIRLMEAVRDAATESTDLGTDDERAFETEADAETDLEEVERAAETELES
ncbi:hypothetical protein GCM10025298_26740 [Natronobiforma cellulositropha]